MQKYPLTSKNSPPVLQTIESNALSKQTKKISLIFYFAFLVGWRRRQGKQA
jgi:hypothetical protein